MYSIWETPTDSEINLGKACFKHSMAPNQLGVRQKNTTYKAYFPEQNVPQNKDKEQDLKRSCFLSVV